MARRSPDDFSNPADDRDVDLTAQFWGSSPSWRTTGELRRTRRTGDRSGPVARTRRHGDRTGQMPVVAPPPAVDEPRIDPLDFGLDDDLLPDFDPFVPPRLGPEVRNGDDARDRRPSDGVGPTGVRYAGVDHAGVDHDEPDELIELEPRRNHPSDPVSELADRLGLGAVDPLLLRLGVIVLIAVLLVPVAMALRPRAGAEAIRTEVAVVVPAAAAASGQALTNVWSDDPDGDAADAADVAGSADSVAAPATTAAVAAAAADPPSATTEPAGTEEASAAARSESPPAVAEGATTQASPTTAAGAADADEPAERVEPVCALSYTVVGGDYWIRIADASGSELRDLLQANLATIHTPLLPGDTICLPAGATVPAPPGTTPPATTTPPTNPPTAGPATTAAPIVTTPPTTAPPAPAVVEVIIREVWPDDLEEQALAVAWRESGYRTNAQSWCCYGLFQIYWSVHQSWLDELGITSATDLFDARANSRAAYALYQRSGGWGPWGG